MSSPRAGFALRGLEQGGDLSLFAREDAAYEAARSYVLDHWAAEWPCPIDVPSAWR